jgi:glycosyltransferase involved in cell wall biosynthesis
MSLRVTFLVSGLNLATGGGSHRTFDLIVTALGRLGLDVRVVSLSGPTSQAAVDPPYTVLVDESWKRPTRFQRLRAVAEVLRRHERDTDVFHVFGPSWAPAAGLYRAHGAVPTVVTLNSYTLWCTNLGRMDGRCHRHCGLLQRTLHAPVARSRKIVSLPMRMLEHFVAVPWSRHIDCFLPASPATKRVYEEAGFDLARSKVIPDLIDWQALRTEAGPSRMDRPADRPVRHLLFAGRLTHHKGVDLLIEALPRIETPVHLHVAGAGRESATLESLARQLGVLDRVTFHGWVGTRELWDLLQEVDVFVHPGRWPEPCARTVIEALALGTPMLVSDVGGPPWIVGSFGRTFRPGDPADLAAQVDRLCSDYGAAVEAAVRGVERAAEFDYRRWVPVLAETYRSVAANGAEAGGRAVSMSGARTR